MADLDRMEWQNGDMTDFNEEEFPEDIDCCLHGVAWCEECPWCDEEEDELDFIVKAD